MEEKFPKVLNRAGVLCALLLVVSSASGEGEPTIEDAAPRSLQEQKQEDIEKVDPLSGNLTIHSIDFRVPGTAGLDIEVHREYNLFSMSAGLMATYKRSYQWVDLGPGWTIAAAPKITMLNRHSNSDNNTASYYLDPLTKLCSGATDGWTTQDLRLALPDGSGSNLFWHSAYEARTTDNWVLRCDSKILTLMSPKGIRYDLGNYDSERRIGVYGMLRTTNPYGLNIVTVRELSETFFVALKATDPSGNWINYSYRDSSEFQNFAIPGSSSLPTSNFSAQRQLTQITASDGRVLNFSYDAASNRLVSIADAMGRSVNYAFSTSDELNDQVLNKFTNQSGDSWLYGYKPGEFRIGGPATPSTVQPYRPLTDESVSSRRLISMQRPAGGITNYTYSFINMESFFGQAQTHNRRERIASRVKSTGESWSYTYTRGQPGEYDTTDVSGPDGVTKYTYVGANYSMGDSPGAGFNNTLWKLGKLVQKNNPDGSYETYAWQPREVSAKQQVTIELGRIYDEKTWAADLQQHVVVRDGATYTTALSNYDAYGNPGTRTETGPNGESRTTTLTWYNDPAKWIIGLPADQSFPGSSISRTYGGNGKLLSYTRDGVSTSFTYDAQGNRAAETRPGDHQYSFTNYKLGIPQTETQPEGITIARVVDDAGNITSRTNGQGYTTQYTFDGLNRVTSVTPPIGNVQTISYTPTNKTNVRGTLTEVTQYDAFGRVASTTRGGIVRTRAYDAYDRVTFISDPDATTGTTYQYDVLGRVVKLTNADGTFQTTAYGPATRTVTDERGKATTYIYRSYGDPDKQFLMSITAPDPAANISLARDTRDQVTTVTQGGFTRTYGYNTNGYLVSINNPETGDTLYGRDIAGNMISSQTGTSGITTYTYDGQNRQTAINYPSGTPSIKKTYDKTGNLLTSSRSGGIRSFAYNAVNMPTQERLSIDGKLFRLSYAYDSNDRLRSVTYSPSGRVIEYTPDVLGRPTTVSGYVDKATYWPNGMIKRITYANGTVTSFGQTARLWPSFFTTEKAAGTEYLKSAYSYDGVGNLLTVNDFVDNNMDRALAYDDINRLVGANGFWGTGTIAYDGVGNLTQQTFGSASLTYDYDAQNRLTALNGQRVGNLSYDAYGNVSGSAGNTYTYDDVPNLVCVNCQSAGSKVEYQYDGLNQRSSVSSAGSKVYEMQDSEGKLRMELDGDTLTEYFYLGDQRVAQRVSP
ncbi:hypothetical protein K5D43_07570 [Pseudomonas cichorii]|nr:hypothetical protein [Pseudomonas cichorii]MBX8554338.1 hypothetical protein [Pseudomonas cichorii]